ncbi:MAG TPA: hypothetical protein ENJ95_16890 [Bacteroidetes bacterium]|nr:hypothetical protein [Bacteroidota bacterium]
MKKNKLFFFGYLGLLASVMVGTGEFLIHFAPGGFDAEIPFGYFLKVPESSLTIGHFLLVPFIPLYVFGYWHIYLALKPGNKKLAAAVLSLGIFAFVIGGIWVGSRAHLGVTVQVLQEAGVPEITDKIMASYELHMENLVKLLRVIVLLISVCFVWAIVKGGTLYPKWMAFFNPILLLLIVFALFFFARPIGQYLAPTAMNVAHFGLFTASLIALKK